MTEPLIRFSDNPILVAQAQRRLRRGQIVPALLIAGMLAACGVLWALARGGAPAHFKTLAQVSLFVAAFVLFLWAPNQIAGALHEERSSGILDFHRATPLTPWTQVVGYVLGCGAREYALTAIFLLLFVPSALLGRMSPPGVVLSLGFVALAGLLYSTFAMWVGLTVSNKRGVSGMVVGVLLMLLLFGWTARSAGAFAFFTPYPALERLVDLSETAELGSDVLFYGISVHPALFTLVVQASVLLFFGWAAARKLRQEGAPSFSRSGALLLLPWILFLSLGSAWSWIINERPALHGDLISVSLVTFALLGTLLASALLISVSPPYLAFMRGLRRARRRGRPVADWLADEGSPWPLTVLFSAPVLFGLAVLWTALRSRMQPTPELPQAALLVLVAVPAFLAFVSGAVEYTRLVRRGSVASTGVLIGFVTMVLPWVLGGIAEAGLGKGLTLYIFALSPGFGLGGAAALFATHSAGRAGIDSLTLASVALSILVTLALAAWFFFSARRVREALAAKIALGSEKAR